MSNTYDLGKPDNIIHLEIIISAIGIEYSCVYITWNDKSWMKLTESNMGTGNIPSFEIGLSTRLKNTYITVKSTLNLYHFNEAEAQSAMNNIYTNYLFDGGLNGKMEFKAMKDDLIKAHSHKLIIVKSFKLT